MKSKCDLILEHYERVWQGEGMTRRWHQGPTDELPKNFFIAEFAPTTARRLWTYATCCMSSTQNDRAIELHLHSPCQDDAHLELLTAICHYHRTGEELYVGHTVNFGRPWLKDSRCDYGLISLPYLDGPVLENLQVGEVSIRCLWLIPITASEREYKRQYGLDSLEEKFENQRFDYANPNRQSVV